MRLILPVSLERTLELEGRFPLLEEEWDRMIEILEAMRPALLESPAGRLEAEAEIEAGRPDEVDHRDDEEPF